MLSFCLLPTSLLHLSFSKDEDFYLQHTLLVLSSVFVRRDSSVIKEEIKAFLANRRISQAVVAQVTGKSRRALYSGIVSDLCLLVQILNIACLSALQYRSVSLGIKVCACDLKPIVSNIMELLQWFFLTYDSFMAFVLWTKVAIFMPETESTSLLIAMEFVTQAHLTAVCLSYFQKLCKSFKPDPSFFT